MNKIKALLSIFFIISMTIACFAQKATKKEYHQKSMQAMDFYDKAMYKECAEKYEEAFALDVDMEISGHWFFASVANAMADNEEEVEKHLLKLVTIATKRDLKKVRINYPVFNQYKQTKWWKNLEVKMDQRLTNLISHHKELKVFRHGRNMVYTAIRINNENDTIANTRIHMMPDGTGWGDAAASLQSQVIYKYEYTSRDSLEHIEELIETVNQDFWIRYDTTGVIENNKKIWMHPFRNNEFFKTEIAPFPHVEFPITKNSMVDVKPKVMILKNWGLYTSSQTECEYEYVGIEQREYKPLGKIECHKYTALGFNNFNGISTIEYFYNKEYGFVEMNYEIHDGDVIKFVIEEVYFTDN